jgi:hypothetical protein
MPGPNGHFPGHPVNLRFHLRDLGIHTGLHAQDGAAEHKQVAHNDDGTAADFAKEDDVKEKLAAVQKDMEVNGEVTYPIIYVRGYHQPSASNSNYKVK